MKVKIEFIDNKAVSPEELVAQVHSEYGPLATVELSPDSNDPFHLMYFAIQELITARQLDSFYDDGPLYPDKLKALMAEAENLARDTIIQVVQDNENKLI